MFSPPGAESFSLTTKDAREDKLLCIISVFVTGTVLPQKAASHGSLDAGVLALWM